jgi:hypothetical protein
MVRVSPSHPYNAGRAGLGWGGGGCEEMCTLHAVVVLCNVVLVRSGESFCLVPRSHRNAGLQLLLHAHVIREEDAPERQSQSLTRSAATRRSARARGSLCGPLRNKKREVGKGLSLADTQTGR